MANRFSADFLRRLRNEIPINKLIALGLGLPNKIADGYFRFQCPVCREFNTSTNPKTNLARCFTCKRNFNTIDMTMIVNICDFKEAVEYLHGYLQN